MLVSGRVAQFVMLLVLCAAVVLFIERARRGKLPWIRKVTGLDAIGEAVGRATEMGRPVICSHGIATMRESTYGPQTIAGMAVLSYVARLCAKYGTRLIVPVRQVEVHPIACELVRTAYVAEGKPELYKEEDIRYLSPFQFGYSAGYIGIMEREKVAANIMVGAYWAEALQLCEAGFRVGAIQVGGTAMTAQLPFFITAADYCLIGEEIYAAGAYLSKDPLQLGTVAGQDIGKFVCTALIIIGVIVLLATGKNWISIWLGL